MCLSCVCVSQFSPSIIFSFSLTRKRSTNQWNSLRTNYQHVCTTICLLRTMILLTTINKKNKKIQCKILIRNLKGFRREGRLLHSMSHNLPPCPPDHPRAPPTPLVPFLLLPPPPTSSSSSSTFSRLFPISSLSPNPSLRAQFGSMRS